MTAIDYEAEYNNRARVPEHPHLMAGWVRDAAAYREAHPPRLLRYGPGERTRIDLFPGGGGGPLVVFIHGGYWQALDSSSFSHCARGLNSHGISVAVPTYDLCPTVSVADIITQMRMACRELAKLGRSDILIIVGGVVPPEDHEKLREAGAAAIFGPGTIITDAAQELLDALEAKRA